MPSYSHPFTPYHHPISTLCTVLTYLAWQVHVGIMSQQGVRDVIIFFLNGQNQRGVVVLCDTCSIRTQRSEILMWTDRHHPRNEMLACMQMCPCHSQLCQHRISNLKGRDLPSTATIPRRQDARNTTVEPLLPPQPHGYASRLSIDKLRPTRSQP